MSDFDTTNVTASGIQDGPHIAEVASAEMRVTKDGEGKYMNVKWQIVGGSSFFQMYTTVNKNPLAVNIGLGEIARMQCAVGMPKGPASAGDFIGKRCLVTVKNKQDGYGDKATAVKYAPAPDDSDIPF